jgi:hypothetical protein
MTAAAIAASTSSRGTAGKRIVKKASGKAKTEAKAKLKEIIRDHDDGLASGPADYTVADAVTSWLTYGLHGRDPNTVANYRTLCDKHIIPGLGARKLRELSAEDVDRWLMGKAKTLSARTVRLLHCAGDTKTKKSHRSLALPRRCVEALQEHRTQQANEREEAGAKWRLRLRGRHSPGLPQRTAGVPEDRERCRTAGEGLDASGDAAQLRLAAVRLRRPPGGHRATRRPQRDRGHRSGLP